MSVGIKPVDERVLIEPIEEEERKVGGIIIPDTATKERPQMGSVIAMGDDIHKKDGGKVLSEILKVGDKVIFAKYGGTEVKRGDKEYLIVSRSDILAIANE